MVENPPASTGDMGSIQGPKRSHVLREGGGGRDKRKKQIGKQSLGNNPECLLSVETPLPIIICLFQAILDTALTIPGDPGLGMVHSPGSVEMGDEAHSQITLSHRVRPGRVDLQPV